MHPQMTARRALASAGVALGLVLTSVAPAMALTIKQNSTDTVKPGAGFSCNSGGEHTDNTYLRRFDLDGAHGVTQAFNVSSVSFGVEQAVSGLDPSQPASVRVYTIAASDPTMTLADLTLLADVSTTLVNSDTGTIKTVPVSATIADPTTTDLVVALFTPNGQAADHSFFLGSNDAAETGPSYIVAPDCGVSEPTTTTALGFPNSHWVLFADGDPGPVVTSIAPTSGPVEGGTSVVITGTDFTDVTDVKFGITGSATSFTVDSPTQITAVSPAAASPATRHVLVVTAGGTSAAVPEDRFTYTGTPPTVTGITPATGPSVGGTIVTITGTGFTSGSKVRFGTAGSATSVTVDSPTQITATSPASASAGIRHVRVTTPGGTSAAVSGDRFAYTYTPSPAISSISPSSGSTDGGTEVVITGTDFTNATQVRFGTAGPATSFSVDSPTQITAVSPASATTGLRHIRVIVAAAPSAPVAADRFNYIEPSSARERRARQGLRLGSGEVQPTLEGTRDGTDSQPVRSRGVMEEVLLEPEFTTAR